MTWTLNLPLHRKVAARVRSSASGMQQADAADEVSKTLDAHLLILYRDAVAVATLQWGLPLAVDGESLRSAGPTQSATVIDADIDTGSWSARLESLDGTYAATTTSVGKSGTDVVVADDIDAENGVSIVLSLLMDDDLSSGGPDPDPDPGELDWFSLIDATNPSAMYQGINLTGQPVVDSNRVGAVLDISGNNNHWRAWDGDASRTEYKSASGGYIEITDNYTRGMAIDGTNRLVDVRKPFWVAMAIKRGGPINAHAVLMDKDYSEGAPLGDQLAAGLDDVGLFCEKLINDSSVGPIVNADAIDTTTWGVVSFGYDGTNLTARVNYETKGVVQDTRPLPDEDGDMVLRLGGNTPSILHYKAVGFLDYYPSAEAEDAGIAEVATLAGIDPGSGPDPDPEPPPPGDHHFFRSDSPWNADIPLSATYYGPSDLRTAQIRKTSVSSGTVVWSVNAQQDYAIPVHQATPGGPTKTIRVLDMFGSRYDEYVTIPWPAGTEPATGTDKHLVILDADGVTAHEMWHCNPIGGGNYVAASYSRTRLDGSGWNLFPYSMESPSNPHGRNPAEAVAGVGAARAVSCGLMGGLITKEDVAAGVINHAIGMAVPREFIRRGPRVYPADPTSSYYDGDSSSNGDLAYSMRLALPRGLNINSLGLSAQWVMVFDAIQRKGIFLFDVGGSGGRTGSIYSEYPGAHSFGMTLRNTQSYAFGQLIPRLEFVDWA